MSGDKGFTQKIKFLSIQNFHERSAQQAKSTGPSSALGPCDYLKAKPKITSDLLNGAEHP